MFENVIVGWTRQLGNIRSSWVYMSTALMYGYHDRAFSDGITLCFDHSTPVPFIKQKIIFGWIRDLTVSSIFWKCPKTSVGIAGKKTSCDTERRDSSSLSHSAQINSFQPQSLFLSLWFLTSDMLLETPRIHRTTALS